MDSELCCDTDGNCSSYRFLADTTRSKTSYQGLDTRKPAPGRLKTACLASEASQNIEVLPEASLDNIPCRGRITNALTRLDCADA